MRNSANKIRRNQRRTERRKTLNMNSHKNAEGGMIPKADAYLNNGDQRFTRHTLSNLDRFK